MEERPKPRIWNGEDYESDPDEDDDEKPRIRTNFGDPVVNVHMR